MPYIKKERRAELVDMDEAADHPIETAGELNFVLTSVLREYVRFHGLNYQIINDVLGALEGAKSEFYRRVAAPYEDTKIQDNGDVY